MQTEKTKVFHYQNAIIEDYTNGNQFNKFMFQVEHATNALPDGYQWSLNDEINFKNSHWAVDIGALNLARHLAQSLKSILVYSKFSRLFIDVNRMIPSSTLFRKNGDKMQIEINQDLNYDEECKRINYHSSYFHALKIAIEKFNPKFIYSIHSFTNCYEGQPRQVEIGILGEEKNDFQSQHMDIILQMGRDCRFNEPWTGGGYVDVGVQSSRHYDNSAILNGFTFEVRNDLIDHEEGITIIGKQLLHTILTVHKNT